MKKVKKKNENFIPNGLSLKPNNLKDKENNIQKNLFVKPILETNEENNDNLNINEENDKNINNKKIIGNNIKMKSNKYMVTLISVTSSEFREGSRRLENYMSTIKFDDTKK